MVIDQLTLGDRVDSPDATKLPVGLAIVLLRDSDGKINLDIPLTGRIDDPEFSVWRIVLQVIVNILTKVATAPFALLGSLFGGGEELSYIEFDAGSTALSEPEHEKDRDAGKSPEGQAGTEARYRRRRGHGAGPRRAHP